MGRMELRLPETSVSDRDIDALIMALDDDGSESLSVTELIDFVHEGTATFFSASNEQDASDEQPSVSKQPSGAISSPQRQQQQRPGDDGAKGDADPAASGRMPKAAINRFQRQHSTASSHGGAAREQYHLPPGKAYVNLSVIEGLPLSGSPQLWCRKGERRARAAVAAAAPVPAPAPVSSSWSTPSASPRATGISRPDTSMGFADGSAGSNNLRPPVRPGIAARSGPRSPRNAQFKAKAAHRWDRTP